MSEEMRLIGMRFRFNSVFLKKICKDFKPEDWSFTPEVGGNPAIWVLGHIALYRRVILRGIQEAIEEEPWEAYFPFSSTPDLTKDYPDAGFLLDDYSANGDRIIERFTALPKEAEEEEWQRELPDGSHTLKACANFFHFHESYHLGQIGYIKRLRGMPGLR